MDGASGGARSRAKDPPGVRVGIRFETWRNEVELRETLYAVQEVVVPVALKPAAPPAPAALGDAQNPLEDRIGAVTSSTGRRQELLP